MKFNVGKFNLANTARVHGSASLGLQATLKAYEVERRASAKAALALQTSKPYPTREKDGRFVVPLVLAASKSLATRGKVASAKAAAMVRTNQPIVVREKDAWAKAPLVLSTNKAVYLRERCRIGEKTPLVLGYNKAEVTREKEAGAKIALNLHATMDPTRLKYAPPAERGDIAFNAAAIVNLLGVDVLHLQLNLQPGESIEINMCELSATINNENAMMFLANDGDFFDFPPGNNELLYEVTPSAVPVQSEIYWKDRWL